MTTSAVIVIPSFNESEALPIFVSELLSAISTKTKIIISDDSSENVFSQTKTKLEEIGYDSEQVLFSRAVIKGGRGAAVRRGFELALEVFPECTHFVECDADGSHRAIDVSTVLNADPEIDLVIGSRYLRESKISNWPKSRMIFSKLLNLIIPRILKIQIHDITNGLRRYSRKALETTLGRESVNSGFTYLSEQALLVSRSGLRISEVPIHFIDRVHGSSTVTHREVIASLNGIRKLIPLSKEL